MQDIAELMEELAISLESGNSPLGRALAAEGRALVKLSAYAASPEGIAEQKRIAAHNAKVRLHNAKVREMRQARANAAENAAIRAAACPTCFTTHAGEC